jgi:hypothetical protein
MEFHRECNPSQAQRRLPGRMDYPSYALGLDLLLGA